jgi:hypothetical protein
MRRFLNDKSGNAVIGAAFMILIFCTIAFLIYSGISIYAKYQAAETELQRAITVTVDTCMVNTNVRDLELDIPAQTAETLLEDNLTQSGWTIGDNNWIKQNEDNIVYSLNDVKISIDGKTIQVTATFVMPVPWAMGNITHVSIPMQVRESVFYVEQ